MARCCLLVIQRPAAQLKLSYCQLKLSYWAAFAYVQDRAGLSSMQLDAARTTYSAAQESDVERGNDPEWPPFIHDRHSPGSTA